MPSSWEEFFEKTKDPGIYIFSSGAQWKNAFYGAEQHVKKFNTKKIKQASDFSSNFDAPLCLGPHIKKASRYYLEQKLFSHNKVFFGNFIYIWREWISRVYAQQTWIQGKIFKEVEEFEKRDILKRILSRLESSKKLSTLSNVWREEKVFSMLLSLIEEFRLAGFMLPESFSQLDSTLKKYSLEEEDCSSDLVQVLQVWEAFFENLKEGNAGKVSCDFPAILKELNTSESPRIDSLYLLGFQHFSLLEVEFIQKLAKVCPIYLPLNESEESLETALKGKDIEYSSSLKSVVHLNTNYTGKIKLLSMEEKRDVVENASHSLFYASTDMEELRSCAFFLDQNKEKFEKVQLIVPPNYFSSTRKLDELNRIFENGAIVGVRASSILELEFMRSLLLGVRLSMLDFPFLEVNCFVQFLSKLKLGIDIEKYNYEVSKLSMVPSNLLEWNKFIQLNKVDIRNIQELVSYLNKIKSIFPENSTGEEYYNAIQQYISDFKLAEFALSYREEENSRNAHFILSSILDAAYILKQQTESSFSLQKWFSELCIFLEKQNLPETRSYNSRIAVYEIGEWLPPLDNKDIRIFLGFEQGVEPKSIHNFIIGESTRKFLSDYALSETKHLQVDFFKWFLNAQDEVFLFSYAKYNKRGKENLSSNAMHLASHTTWLWPPLHSIYARISEYEDDKKNFIIPEGGLKKSLSATFLDDWKKCPFRSLVQKKWSAVDKLSEYSLDIHNMDIGNIVHECLDIFFKEEAHKNASKEERRRILQEILSDVFEDAELNSYKGNSLLLKKEKEILLSRLEKITDAEFQYYETYSSIDKTMCEEGFSYKIEDDLSLTGKIDRIDIDSVGEKFLIVDYKNSKSIPTTSDIKNYESFQLPLYLEVAEKELALGEPLGACYLSTIDTTKRNIKGILLEEYKSKDPVKYPDSVAGKYYFSKNRTFVHEAEFNEIREGFKKEILSAWKEIKAGKFLVKPNDPNICSRCSVRPACRIKDKVYSLEVDRDKELSDYQNIWTEVRKGVDVSHDLKEKIRFNAHQEKILSSEGNFTFLEASAGTGKTTILVEKYFREFKRLADEGMPLELLVDSILAISFTEKSVADMKAKLFSKISDIYGQSIAFEAIQNVNTIHGFCRSIIKETQDKINPNPTADILDEIYGNRLFKLSLEEFYLSLEEEKLSEYRDCWDVVSQIIARSTLDEMLLAVYDNRISIENDSLWKDNLEKLKKENNGFLFHNIYQIFQAVLKICNRKKQEESVLDYNDLEGIALRILSKEKFSRRYIKKYKLVLVDEFQDTNETQNKIISRITNRDSNKLFVVGDAKQSIYNFRGADVGVFLKKRKAAEESKQLHALSNNYRSQKHIVEFSNILSSHLFNKESSTEFDPIHMEVSCSTESSNPVVIHEYETEVNSNKVRSLEAQHLVKIIHNLQKKGNSLEDIVVLSPFEKSISACLNFLREAGIPYSVNKGGRIFNESIVLDSIALLRYLYSEENKLSFLTILRSPWGKAKPSLISEFIADNKNLENEKRFFWLKEIKNSLHFLSPSQILWKSYSYYSTFAHQHVRLQAEKFLSIVEENEKKIHSPLELIQFLSSLAGWRSESEASKEASMPSCAEKGVLQLMTIHGAKGLEYPVSILIGISEGFRSNSSKVYYREGKKVSIQYKDLDGKKCESLGYNDLHEEQKAREIAEKKRILYVAVTRAKKEMHIIARKYDKLTMGSYILEADFKEHAKREPFYLDDATDKGKTFVSPKKASSSLQALLSNFSKSPEAVLLKSKASPNYLKRNMSVSELTAFEFCPYFHRWKFLNQWKDSVLEILWTKKKSRNHGASRKSLPVTKKERGIALHQLLERLDKPEIHEKQWKTWLLDSYYAQGVSQDQGESLGSLLDSDIECLKKFLSSEDGKLLFSSSLTAFPEISFLLEHSRSRISGAIDRLLVDESGENYWVVDYKTSTLRPRHHFQVFSYGLALKKYLEERATKGFQIHLWLVDILGASTSKLSMPSSNWENQSFTALEKNYGKEEFSSHLLEKVSAESCKACPYISYCGFAHKST